MLTTQLWRLHQEEVDSTTYLVLNSLRDGWVFGWQDYVWVWATFAWLSTEVVYCAPNSNRSRLGYEMLSIRFQAEYKFNTLFVGCEHWFQVGRCIRETNFGMRQLTTRNEDERRSRWQIFNSNILFGGTLMTEEGEKYCIYLMFTNNKKNKNKNKNKIWIESVNKSRGDFRGSEA